MSLLTKREKEIFTLLLKTKTTKEIASILRISEKTVRNHISNVIQKLGVTSRSSAIIELLKTKDLTLLDHFIFSFFFLFTILFIRWFLCLIILKENYLFLF